MASNVGHPDFGRIATRLTASSERIHFLKELRKTRLLQEALAGLPRHMQRARLDCLIYFYVIQFGNYRVRERDEFGNTTTRRVARGPVFVERRLGCPTMKRVVTAVWRINKECREEAREYKRAYVRFREARRRFLATTTEKSWNWYWEGWNNRMCLRYRYWFYLNFGLKWSGWDYGYFKYFPHELNSRLLERRRAQREASEELATMQKWRAAIFEKMEIPEAFRTLI